MQLHNGDNQALSDLDFSIEDDDYSKINERKRRCNVLREMLAHN